MSFVPRRSARLQKKMQQSQQSQQSQEQPLQQQSLQQQPNRAKDIYTMCLAAWGIPGGQFVSQILNLRRSDRLAKKRVQPPTAKDKYAARRLFEKWQNNSVSDEYKRHCVNKIREFLDIVDRTVGRIEKARVCISVHKFILENPTFSAVYPTMTSAFLKKMKEFQHEQIDNLLVSQAFHKSVNDVIYMITGKN